MSRIIKMDKRGRIIIPAEIRDLLKTKEYFIEVTDKNTIILRPTRDRKHIVKEIEKIKLKGDKTRTQIDAASVKHRIEMID